MSTIGQRIKEKRIELGLTQAELGEKLHVTDRAVSKWELDAGNPDMSIVASLADVLGVSLDFLLSGKKTEEKVVIKTPKEMLFETDDPKYLDKVTDLNIDDMYKHQLANVFIHILERGKISLYCRTVHNTKDYGKIIFLFLISNSLEKMSLIRFADIGYAKEQDWSKEMMDSFVSDERVSDETRRYVLTTHCRVLQRYDGYGPGENNDTKHAFGEWPTMYPKFLEAFTSAKKWEWVKYLIDVANKINKQVAGLSTRVGGFAISLNVMKSLLEEKQYDLLEEANAANVLIGQYTISKKEIEIEKLKNNPDVSLKDRLIFEFSNGYILNIDKLLESKTVKVEGPSRKDDKEGYIENLLKQYKSLYEEIIMGCSTSYIELVYRGLGKKDLNIVYKLSVDKELITMLEALMNGNQETILEAAKKTFINIEKKEDEKTSRDVRQRAGAIRNVPPNSELFKISINYNYGVITLPRVDEIPNNIEDAIKYFEKIKMAKFDEWVKDCEGKLTRFQENRKIKNEYLSLKEEYKREYFNNLISNGQEDLAIVILCKKLESILKYRYGYSGDLKSMLDSLFSGPLKSIEAKEPYDDEYSYELEEYKRQKNMNIENERKRKYLSKLRMKRNDITHSDSRDIDFSTEDLRTCIDIVEEIG